VLAVIPKSEVGGSEYAIECDDRLTADLRLSGQTEAASTDQGLTRLPLEWLDRYAVIMRVISLTGTP